MQILPETQKLNILIIPDKRFPIQHPLLEHIFARQLPRRGHTITWLAQSVTAQKFGETAAWHNTEVILNPLLAGENRLAQVQNTFYRVPRGFLSIFRILKTHHIDIVQVRNDLFAALFALLACRLRRVPFVYYLAFPIPEAALENARRGLTRSKWISRLIPQMAIPLRNWIVRQADHVLVMSEFWQGKIIHELGLPLARVTAIPFGFDTRLNVAALDGAAIRQKYGLEGHPVVLYLGTIAPPRDVDILVDILAEVAARIPEVRLFILPGLKDGRFVPALQAQFAARSLAQNVVFADSVPHEQVYAHIAAADVGLSPIEPLPLYQVSSPAKFAEMLGVGCPVVASDTPEQKTVITAWKCGLCVPYEAPAFAAAVVELLQNPEQAARFRANGRAYIEAERSYAHLADKIEDIYLELTNPADEWD